MKERKQLWKAIKAADLTNQQAALAAMLFAVNGMENACAFIENVKQARSQSTGVLVSAIVSHETANELDLVAEESITGRSEIIRWILSHHLLGTCEDSPEDFGEGYGI